MNEEVWPELRRSREEVTLVLDELKRRGMTAESVSVGSVTLTGLRYPLPKAKSDGDPVEIDVVDDEDLTFASAG